MIWDGWASIPRTTTDHPHESRGSGIYRRSILSMGGLGLGALLLAACTPTDNSSGAVSAATATPSGTATPSSAAPGAATSSGGLSGFDEFASTVKTFISGDYWMAESTGLFRGATALAVNGVSIFRPRSAMRNPSPTPWTAMRSTDLSSRMDRRSCPSTITTGTRIRPESTTSTAPPPTPISMADSGEELPSRRVASNRNRSRSPCGRPGILFAVQ